MKWRMTDSDLPRIKGWLRRDFRQEIDLPLCSEILPGLWVGGHPHSSAPADAKAVVNLSGDRAYDIPYDIHPGQVYIEHGIEDSNRLPDMRLFDALARSIGFILERNGPVLIHCQAGINRSAFLAARVMSLTMGVSPDMAVKFLREKRSPLLLENSLFYAYVMGLPLPLPDERYDLSP